MNGSHSDLIRACSHDLLLRYQMLLELLAILHAPWLRAALIWWRGRWFRWKVSRRRSGHVGCGRRRRMGVSCGLAAWIDEAEQCEGGPPARGAALQARSEGFNLKRNAETEEMWLLVRGRGQGGIYFRGSRKFWIALAKKLLCNVSSDTVPYSELCMICEHHKRFR